MHPIDPIGGRDTPSCCESLQVCKNDQNPNDPRIWQRDPLLVQPTRRCRDHWGDTGEMGLRNAPLLGPRLLLVWVMVAISSSLAGRGEQRGRARGRQRRCGGWARARAGWPVPVVELFIVGQCVRVLLSSDPAMSCTEMRARVVHIGERGRGARGGRGPMLCLWWRRAR